jgi:hypothetical protein
VRLIYTDKRLICELVDFEPSGPISMRPVAFTAKISDSGASLLAEQRPEFFRAEDGEGRFTLTIDKIDGVNIQGTIRRR